MKPSILWAVLAIVAGIAVGAAVAERRGTGQGAQEAGHGRGQGSSCSQSSGSGHGNGQGQGFGQSGNSGHGQGQGQGVGQGQGFGQGQAQGRGTGADFVGHGASSEGTNEVKGSTIVAEGLPITVEGALKQDGHEWQLISNNGIHNIHLGPEHYRESQGVELAEGLQAVVTGFSIGEDIAVGSLNISGTTYIFRGEDGSPAWAGGGQGTGGGHDLGGPEAVEHFPMGGAGRGMGMGRGGW